MMWSHASSAKNVIGKHDVKVIQMQSLCCAEQSKFGVEVSSQACDTGGTSGRSGRPDRVRQEENSSGRPDSESEHGSGC